MKNETNYDNWEENGKLEPGRDMMKFVLLNLKKKHVKISHGLLNRSNLLFSPTADAVGLVQLTPLPSLAAFAACFSCSFRRLQLSPPPSSEFF